MEAVIQMGSELGKRAASKARSRQILIDATLDVIADLGIAEASVTRILEGTNLSRGMINVHFDSKQHLLLEAIKDMAAQYFDDMFDLTSASGDDPEDKLVAMISADMHERLLNKRSTAIWFAFRGESRTHKIFSAHTDTRDEKLTELYATEIERLLSIRNLPPEQLKTQTRTITHGVIAMLEGMWVDFFLHSENYDREQSKRVIFSFLSAMLPEHETFKRLAKFDKSL